MVSATDIITYIGVPLAVLGVMPMLSSRPMSHMYKSTI